MERLEQYLSKIERSLHGMPEDVRRLELQEIRGHLQEAAAAETKRGASIDDAQLAAIRRFGDAGTVGRTLASSWYRRAGLSPGSVPAAMLSVVVWTAAGVLIPIASLMILTWFGGPGAVTPGVLLLMECWITVAPPLAAGAIATLLNPGCPAGVITALLGASALLVAPLQPGAAWGVAIVVSWLALGAVSSLFAQRWLGFRRVIKGATHGG